MIFLRVCKGMSLFLILYLGRSASGSTTFSYSYSSYIWIILKNLIINLNQLHQVHNFYLNYRLISPKKDVFLITVSANPIFNFDLTNISIYLQQASIRLTVFIILCKKMMKNKRPMSEMIRKAKGIPESCIILIFFNFIIFN
jgi:hypothetical protein